MRTAVSRSISIIGSLLLMISTLAIPAVASADANSVVPGITITKLNDGTAAFDATNDPGSDSSSLNGIIRTNDTATFSVNYSFSDPLAGAPTP